ncbi:hypothetical protein [Comamonas sp. NoAH]|uniref:hypothetical protein n=1 Tax=Comamonas halotolerans TaxID=3041496 RepID=UPI0024E04692|nr:hypothetical protein [Comamonas sp. NoAH]
MFELDFWMGISFAIVLVIGLRMVFGFISQRPINYSRTSTPRSDTPKPSDYPFGGEGF